MIRYYTPINKPFNSHNEVVFILNDEIFDHRPIRDRTWHEEIQYYIGFGKIKELSKEEAALEILRGLEPHEWIESEPYNNIYPGDWKRVI
jgi:hypothetical protein